MDSRSLNKYLYLSIAAALVTILLKFYAFHVTGSMGFFSDALESFVNLFAALFALLMLHLSIKPADQKHEFGHGKAEYFSSAVEGALILVAAFTIIRSAIPRLIDPSALENIGRGLVFSLLAALVNLFVGLILINNGKKKKSLLIEADGRHLMTDVYTTIGVVLGIILVEITGWLIIDPIIAILVAFNIIYSGYKLIARSARELMDASMPEDELAIVINYLDSLKGRQIEYHSLLTRMSGQRRFISLHLLVPGEWSVKLGHDYADEIEEAIIAMFRGPVTVSTHIEPVEDPASLKDIGIDRVEIDRY